jgi:hypothetical protein
MQIRPPGARGAGFTGRGLMLYCVIPGCGGERGAIVAGHAGSGIGLVGGPEAKLQAAKLLEGGRIWRTRLMIS